MSSSTSSGWSRARTEFMHMYKTGDASGFLLIGRMTSVVAGTILVPASYILGSLLYGRREALTGAFLTAVAFLLVRDSHFSTPDMFVALLVVVSLILVTRVKSSGATTLWAVSSGVAVGLTVGTKFSVWPLALAIPVAYFALGGADSRSPARSLSLLIVAGASFCAGFAVGYPPVVFNPPHFAAYVEYLLETSRHGHFPQLVLNAPPAWRYYLSTMTWAVGTPLAVIVAIGLVRALYERRAVELPMMTYVVVVLVFLSMSRGLLFARYLIPVVAPLLLMGGVAIWRGADAIGARLDRDWLRLP